MNRSKQLGEDKISSLLWKFSIPAIVGMLVNALYNVVDRVFVGRAVGDLGIAAITIGFPIMLIMMAFSMMIGIGATSLVSIKLGEQKKDDAQLVIGNAVVLLFIVSVLITIVGTVFLNPMLNALGASDAVLPYAKDYMFIILLGTLFSSIAFGMNGFIRAQGDPKIAMLTMLIGAALNFILNPIFIFVFDMGIKGSALSTVISQFVSAIWIFSYFISEKSHLKIHLRNLKLSSTTVGRIIAIGMAPFFMQTAASVVTIMLNNNLAHYGGDVAVAAIGIVSTIAMLFLMPILGINQGAQPIIGYNYGAEQFDRVKNTLKIAAVAATLIVSSGYVVMMLMPHQIVSMFIEQNVKDRALIEFGAYALRIYLLFMPVIGFQIVGASYFQAVGKPKQAMILSLSRQVLLFIPALIILPRFFGLNGVLYSGPAADLGAAVVTAIWLYAELKHLHRRHEETLVEEV